MERDSLYQHKQAQPGNFSFDDEVASVFNDMIQRSVPGYATTLKQIGTLAAAYVPDNSNCYDLGCSLGASSLAMAQHIKSDACQVIAVDNAQPMLDRCAQLLEQESLQTPILLRCEDILNTFIEQAAMVVMNFTLQFIALDKRQALIQRIYDGMRPGGICVISEKIKLADDTANDFMIDMHHAFKRANGYSDLEISQKRNAIEDVLIPETIECHRQRLKTVGFQHVEQWFQCFNFVSLVAQK